MDVICYCDGGAKPNPGKCYGSFQITGLDNETIRIAKTFGEGTNNQAEYWTLIELLKYLKDRKVRHARINIDSRLMYKQLIGHWQVKSPRLRCLWQECKTLLRVLGSDIELHRISGDHMKRILGH